MFRRSISILILIIAATAFTIPLHGSNTNGFLAKDDFKGNQCTGLDISCSFTITTTLSNDLIFVWAYTDSGSQGVKTVTDTANTAYSQRASVFVTEEWTGKTGSFVGSDTITVTLNHLTNSNWAAQAIAITNTNIASPFDSPAPSKATNNACSGWPTLSTNAATTLVLAFAGENSLTFFTPDQGWTEAGTLTNIADTEFQIFSATQSNLSPNFQQTPCSGGATWGMILDAVISSTSSLPTTGGGPRYSENPPVNPTTPPDASPYIIPTFTIIGVISVAGLAFIVGSSKSKNP